ncbi:hypothetical protein [Streptomyces nigrescens]|uniref:Uncharacterized protein n=1 Tax=Streptomyces nigrescens TaxID=1920 RepID=A0ABY7IXL7_STRNI|nr:hypothetical protein [Streptomyces nigrescens]WAU03033.1 hypothetical protein STRNI_001132 [Streptomyces nigrescens]
MTRDKRCAWLLDRCEDEKLWFEHGNGARHPRPWTRKAGGGGGGVIKFVAWSPRTPRVPSMAAISASARTFLEAAAQAAGDDGTLAGTYLPMPHHSE